MAGLSSGRQLHGHLRDITVRIRAVVFITVSAVLPVAGASLPEHRFSLKFETGVVRQSRNQIQIPNSSAGTRFTPTDIQGNGPEAHRRVERSEATR
jgi:hypothetical protein